MDDPLQRENGETIVSTLSNNCQCVTATTIRVFALDGNEVESAATMELAELPRIAVNLSLDSRTPETRYTAETISLAAVTMNERPKNPFTILDWTSSTTVTAQVSQLDGLDEHCFFKSDKTY